MLIIVPSPLPGNSDTVALLGVVVVASSSLYGFPLLLPPLSPPPPSQFLSCPCGMWRLRQCRSDQMPAPTSEAEARQPMAMPAMAPGETDLEEVGVDVEVVDAVALAEEEEEEDERVEPWGRASPGLRARVAAAAARFWTASWVGDAWLWTKPGKSVRRTWRKKEGREND